MIYISLPSIEWRLIDCEGITEGLLKAASSELIKTKIQRFPMMKLVLIEPPTTCVIDGHICSSRYHKLNEFIIV